MKRYAFPLIAALFLGLVPSDGFRAPPARAEEPAKPLVTLPDGLLLAQADKPAEKPAAAPRGRGYKPLPPAQRKALHDAAFKRHGYLMRVLAKNVTPPPAFDTATMGWNPPVVDQGQCGDCYGGSMCDALTSAFIKAGWGKSDGTFKISDQFGLDCGAFEGGCGGGDEAQVAEYAKTKGFPAEKYLDAAGNKLSDYGPYTSSPGQCQLKPSAKLWKLKDWGYVAGDQGQGPAKLEEYKAALMTYGRLSIALDAGGQFGDGTTVITSMGSSIDHAITCDGWDDNKDCGDGTKGAIIVHNNWGEGWGDKGRRWIAYHEVPQIVEPIWLVCESITPPPTPPGPVPPGPVPPGPVPPGPVPPGPIPGVPVTVTLTPEQVASVIQQSGATVIHGDMTLRELVAAINLAASKGKGQGYILPQYIGPPTESQMAKDIADLKRAVDALLKAALKE